MNYKEMLTLVFPLILILFFGNGCATFSSMQTAKVLNKNQKEMGGAIHMPGLLNQSDFEIDEEYIADPVIEFHGRYGLGSKLDVGLKVSSSVGGTVLPDLKWQFLGNEESKFAMATGMAFGYSPVLRAEVSLLQFQLPLYMSYHPSEKWAFYLNPKGIVSGNQEGVIGYYGGSLGMTFGEKLKVGLETSVFQLVSEDLGGQAFPIIQSGLGVKYQF